MQPRTRRERGSLTSTTQGDVYRSIQLSWRSTSNFRGGCRPLYRGFGINFDGCINLGPGCTYSASDGNFCNIRNRSSCSRGGLRFGNIGSSNSDKSHCHVCGSLRWAHRCEICQVENQLQNLEANLGPT